MNSITDQRQGDRREESLDLSRTRVPWPVVAWLLAVIVGCLVSYTAAANTFNARVVVLETQQKNTDARLVEIQSYLQALNLKMDQLLLASARR